MAKNNSMKIRKFLTVDGTSIVIVGLTYYLLRNKGNKLLQQPISDIYN